MTFSDIFSLQKQNYLIYSLPLKSEIRLLLEQQKKALINFNKFKNLT